MSIHSIIFNNIHVFQFIKACQAVDSSAEMQFIIKQKIRKHYSKADKGFLSSASFRRLLGDLKAKVENDQQNLFVHITDLVDELKARKVCFFCVYEL